MRISAPDTAAGGVGMMVWEEGRGLVYLLKISRRCAQGMLVHSFELSACSKNHRGHGGHRDQADDCGVFIISIGSTIIIYSFIYFLEGTRERIPNRPPSPHQISAPDTAAGGVGMMVWEEGGGLLYLLKISRRCAQMWLPDLPLHSCRYQRREK